MERKEKADKHDNSNSYTPNPHPKHDTVAPAAQSQSITPNVDDQPSFLHASGSQAKKPSPAFPQPGEKIIGSPNQLESPSSSYPRLLSTHRPTASGLAVPFKIGAHLRPDDSVNASTLTLRSQTSMVSKEAKEKEN